MDYEKAKEFKKKFIDNNIISADGDIAKSFFDIFPELAESEDERIRKELIEFVGEAYSAGNAPEKCAKWLVWLKNQKEQKPTKMRDIISGDAIEACMLRYLQSAANRKDDIEIIEDTIEYKKQLVELILKEQKPSEWSEEDEKMLNNIRCVLHSFVNYVPSVANPSSSSGGVPIYQYQKEIDWLKSLSLNLKKKNEDVAKLCSNKLSKENEMRVIEAIKRIDELEFLGIPCSNVREVLESLRPQLKTEIHKAAVHDLAIRFMNHLDNNRPKDKINLSNSECEDIYKAFADKDWDKILRYVEKYKPH